MGFVASVFTAVVDVVVSIVETVVQVVEMAVQAVMVLLGFDGGSTQVIEYYEVHNVPLFDDVDDKNPLQQSIIQSIVSDEDIASNLLYHIAFRSLKGNVKEFMDYIDNGNYFEGFPTVESYILTVDYDEVTDVLDTINSTACTIETAFLRALSKSDWVKYWLQENRGYDVGINRLGVGNATVTTSPITPAADTVQVTPSTNHFDIDITSEIATSDSVTADQRWYVNLNTISYNSSADTYTIPAYQNNGISITLPYTAPTKPTQIHYVVSYYRNAVPARIYLFIYKAGSGTYTALDTIEEPIDIDGATLETLPAVPLRISNSNYTTFGATKQAAIENILKIIHLDAEEVLDAVLTDPGVASNLGDIDNIYVNFGVRMWDTSQAGMGYLFRMFENLYPSQGITQGTYNNTPATDEKPQNNILTSTDDNNAAFQWSYITYTHTSLATINSNSGSTENGIYYSDMSKFDDDDVLLYNYYVSSGKGTYNVGYKADNLDEVQDFLDGNGVTNPGTTSGEATNWLQVTTRLSYNNPTPNLLESDNSASTLIYLTPDAIYENNGSGTLRLVEKAAPETTIGQSITYYCCKPSGLDAYTVVAPIGALRVVDGDSGKFKMVKFNLGAKEDLMVPFIHTFIKDLSNTDVSRLFLAGAHVSIFIAHYEVIHHAGMSVLTALVMIVVIVVVAYIAWPAIKAGFAAMKAGVAKLGAALAAGNFLATAWTMFLTNLPKMLLKMAVQYIVELIITEIAGDNEMLAMILNIAVMAAISSWEVDVTYGSDSSDMFDSFGDMVGDTATDIDIDGWNITNIGKFAALTPIDYASIAVQLVTGINSVAFKETLAIGEEIAKEAQTFQQQAQESLEKYQRIAEEIAGSEMIKPTISPQQLTGIIRARNRTGAIGSNKYFALFTEQFDIPYTVWAYSESMNTKISHTALYETIDI